MSPHCSMRDRSWDINLLLTLFFKIELAHSLGHIIVSYIIMSVFWFLSCFSFSMLVSCILLLFLFFSGLILLIISFAENVKVDGTCGYVYCVIWSFNLTWCSYHHWIWGGLDVQSDSCIQRSWFTWTHAKFYMDL